MSPESKFHSINDSIQNVINAEPNAVPLSAGGRIAQLVKVYAGIRPLLKALQSMIFLPPNWHRAIDIFISSVDAIVAGAGEVDAEFKAGKDL